MEADRIFFGPPLDVPPHILTLSGIDRKWRRVPALRLENRAKQEGLPDHLDAACCGRILDAHRGQIAIRRCKLEPERDRLRHHLFLALKLLELDPLGLNRFWPEAAFLVFQIGTEIALEPFNMAVAFKGENMGCHPVQEPTVV